MIVVSAKVVTGDPATAQRAMNLLQAQLSTLVLDGTTVIISKDGQPSADDRDHAAPPMRCTPCDGPCRIDSVIVPAGRRQVTL